MIHGLRLMVKGVGYRVQGSRFWDQDKGSRSREQSLCFVFTGLGFRVQGLRFRCWDKGLRVEG
jgi:hypothetical protein